MEKQRTVMPVTETFMVKRVLEITRLSAVKRKTQFANRCIAVKIVAQNLTQKSQHKCECSKCVTCKKYLPNDHECFVQPYKFLDEIAYDNAGQDEELIGKADTLYKQRLQKNRYIVWDIETFALNQQSGKGRQVPHLLIAVTTCYICYPLKSKFATRVDDIIKPENVFQMKLGKLTIHMSKSLVGRMIQATRVKNADNNS